MAHYLSRRTIIAILTVIFVLIINFFIIHLAPGDPVRILAGIDNPSEEVIENLREKYGLNEPLAVQFGVYVKNLLKGDLGWSLFYDIAVIDLIGDRIGPTLLLTLTGAILALIIGTLLGVFTALRSGSKLETFISFITYTLYSMPAFWLGIMLILLFSLKLGLLPTSGMIDVRSSYTGIAYYLDILRHMLLPTMTLALIQIPIYYRISQASVLQVLNEDFIVTFKAVGMNDKKIFRKYALKNAILPVITVFGISMAYLVAGSALIEIVFSWPGMGRLMLEAIMRRDYPLLMGIYFILSLSVAVMMIVTDVVYAYIDPRIRYQ